MDLTEYIRTIPHYPKQGIMFRDITTLMGDGPAFKFAIDALAEHFADMSVTTIVGIEARGFVFGAAVAAQLGIGFVPLRKPGKLPHKTLSVSYDLEYGQDTLHMHEDGCRPGQRVAIIDDLIATGGTAIAAAELVKLAGGSVVGAGFVVDLPELDGANRLIEAGVPVHVLCAFDGH